MISSEAQIHAFKRIAQSTAEVLIKGDYGSSGLEVLKDLTDGIRIVYKHLTLSRHKKIVIINSIDDKPLIPSLGIEYDHVIHPETFTSVSDESLFIELKKNGEFFLVKNNTPNITSLRNDAIVYCYENDRELFYGKSGEAKLLPISGIDSYFAISTFKSLDEALEYYRIKYVLNSTCKTINKTWTDNKTRIFFSPKPEFALRDSLYDFLEIRLRENIEYAKESVMDDSHPVDIKLTWNYTSHIAIIEVKWIGKSLKGTKTSEHSEARALKGAKQLAEYLEMINRTSADKITRGYLVVFDARRNKTKPSTTSVNCTDGLHFESRDISYNPEYHNVKELNFAKPLRFFIKPVCTP